MHSMNLSEPSFELKLFKKQLAMLMQTPLTDELDKSAHPKSSFTEHSLLSQAKINRPLPEATNLQAIGLQSEELNRSSQLDGLIEPATDTDPRPGLVLDQAVMMQSGDDIKSEKLDKPEAYLPLIETNYNQANAVKSKEGSWSLSQAKINRPLPEATNLQATGLQSEELNRSSQLDGLIEPATDKDPQPGLVLDQAVMMQLGDDIKSEKLDNPELHLPRFDVEYNQVLPLNQPVNLVDSLGVRAQDSEVGQGFVNSYQLPETDVWSLAGQVVQVPFSSTFLAQINTLNSAGKPAILNAEAKVNPLLNRGTGLQTLSTAFFSELPNKLSGELSLNVQHNQAMQLQSFVQQAVRQLQVGEQQAVLRDSERKTDLTKDALLPPTPDQSARADRPATIATLASISYPLNHAKWNEALGRRIVFMANQQMQQAQISLNPEKLGPIQLRLQLDRDQMVSVSISAQLGATKEALEAAIPRLKEMLSEAGIAFSDVNVEDEAIFDDSREQQSSQNTVNSSDESEATEETVNKTIQSDNLIDFYV